MLRHEALRVVELVGTRAQVWPVVLARAQEVGRVRQCTETHGSLLLGIRRRLGKVDVGVHLVDSPHPGRVKAEIVAVGTGVTDRMVVEAAELVASRLAAG